MYPVKSPVKSAKTNFWTTCPRKLGYHPESTCPLGKEGASSARAEEKGCSWYINSPEDNYCFWTWIRRVSNKEGFMEPLLQHEVSEKLNMSNSKILVSYKEAMLALKNLEEYQDLKELFED